MTNYPHQLPSPTIVAEPVERLNIGLGASEMLMPPYALNPGQLFLDQEDFERRVG